MPETAEQRARYRADRRARSARNAAIRAEGDRIAGMRVGGPRRRTGQDIELAARLASMAAGERGRLGRDPLAELRAGRANNRDLVRGASGGQGPRGGGNQTAADRALVTRAQRRR